MSFAELTGLMSGLKVDLPMPIHTALTQRLYEIALFDHHVALEDRAAAREWLDQVKSFVETGFKDHPEAFTAYRMANQEMESAVSQFGVGSLAWLVEEHSINNTADLVNFIARPEYAHLLEAFYETVGRPTTACG
jgi:hypothetical protein